MGVRRPLFYFFCATLHFQGGHSTSWSAAGPQASPITHCERWTPLCLLTPNQMIFHKQATSDVKWNLPACSIPGLFLWTLYQFPNRVQSLTDNVCVDWGGLLCDSKGPWERPRSVWSWRSSAAQTMLNFILRYLPNCVCSFDDRGKSTLVSD